ncbi:SRPBCC family protein [Halomicroarcula sp. F13]|uniref:SRPBCC family protein n=1 Tax=Haloarcula rubra TaxID=2487747 RepID=A0AAW4PN19_9EURY|nr:SRPBCC family protein [Halomicroarcula rubra]MBX0321614.1 SRPBCC family protein [Halomicroarcula rubra]
MPVFEREVRVSAPLSEVWEFHSTADGLVALTPDWMHLRVEETRGPDGDPDPEVLEAGSVVVSSVKPFGVAPRQRWVSEIVAREESEAEAMFRDVMTEGPFPEWEHTHRFRADGDDATIVHDRVEYELPGGPLGRAVGPIGFLGMEPMFRYRHRETRALLEA